MISPLPQPSWMIWQTNREVVAEVDRLLDDHTDGRIAALLNEKGWHSGKGGMFTRRIIARIRNQYRLRSRFDRLREAGMLTQRRSPTNWESTRRRFTTGGAAAFSRPMPTMIESSHDN